jgi:hypothetical protein
LSHLANATGLETDVCNLVATRETTWGHVEAM